MRVLRQRLRGLRFGLVVVLAVLTWTASWPGAAVLVPRSPEAQRVFDALDRLRLSASEPRPARLRTIVLTDRELNAYIAYRLQTEKSDALRDMRLKLLPGNRLEGMMFIDLKKIGAPSFLPTALRFFFSGRLMVQSAQVKFDVQELFLGYKSVPVFLLDIAFFIASKTQKHGPSGLSDWYTLPLGIRDISTDTGRVTLSY